jgi:hypothetical protein
MAAKAASTRFSAIIALRFVRVIAVDTEPSRLLPVAVDGRLRGHDV